LTGQVKTLRSNRGFGFIAAEDGKEYFFHHSGVLAVFDNLQLGDAVVFDVEPSPKGPRAIAVQRIAVDAPEPAA
jgi:CspA family cold shock protein